MMDVPKDEALVLIDARMAELRRRAQYLRRELPLAVGRNDVARTLAETTLRSVEHLLGLYDYRKTRIIRADEDLVRMTSGCAGQTDLRSVDIEELL